MIDNYIRSYSCALLAIIALLFGETPYAFFIAMLGAGYYSREINKEINNQ